MPKSHYQTSLLIVISKMYGQCYFLLIFLLSDVSHPIVLEPNNIPDANDK